MSELRLSLLIIGCLFICGIVGWEWWRKRRRSRVDGAGEPAAAEAVRAGAPRGAADDRSHGAPQELPSLTTREPALGELPVVHIDDAIIAPDAVTARGTPLVAKRATLDDEPDTIDVRVEWPPEAERRIVALRIVPRSGRFAGLRIRQALVGDGYVHGAYDIFHRPGPDGKVIVSAASLTKPGYFELARMDQQTFAGLNLFCVLPGPLPPLAAFDMLLGSARNLAQRLGGELQDGSGEPLSDERIVGLRDTLRAPSFARAAGAG
ncbi:MAG: hypothetical protein NZM12_06310 [Steroidobacteraceae bacterium]|nr:hypothetical protein [Steroidobacteraceae bacterium]MDW8260752.1 cell division protein ZipA C-terminal FtsZ-binding domain-containing protein [Gammaproteobacteria bacterium]